MKTLVILGSARSDGNTRQAVTDILSDTPHTLLDLNALPITPYSYTDWQGGDNFEKIVDQMLTHDRIIFATPVYWYAMSTPMKTLFDRFSDLLNANRLKPKGKALKGRESYLISTGSDRELPDGYTVPFARTSQYFDIIYRGQCYICVADEADIPAQNAKAIQTFKTLLRS